MMSAGSQRQVRAHLHVILSGALAMSVVNLSACSNGRAYPEFRAELVVLQRRTTPRSGRVLTTSAPELKNGTLRATWETAPGMPWSEYTNWVTRELASAAWTTPAQRPPRGQPISFLWSSASEIFVLALRAGSMPSRVRFTFVVVPD